MGVSTPDEVSMNMASLAEAQQVPAAIWADAKAAGLIPAGLAL